MTQEKADSIIEYLGDGVYYKEHVVYPNLENPKFHVYKVEDYYQVAVAFDKDDAPDGYVNYKNLTGVKGHVMTDGASQVGGFYK